MSTIPSNLRLLPQRNVADAQAGWSRVTQSAALGDAFQLPPDRQAGWPLTTDAGGMITWVHPQLEALAARQGLPLAGRAAWHALSAERGGANRELEHEYRMRTLRERPFRLRADDGWAFDIEAHALPGATPGWLLLCAPAEPLRPAGIDEADILASLSDNLPISLMALSLPDLNVFMVNQRAREEFAVPEAVELPAGLDALFGDGMRQHLMPSLRRVLQTGAVLEHDFAWSGPGTQRVVSARHVAVSGADGNPRLLITLLRDITERRQSEIELLESELRFKELVEAIDDGVFVTTPSRDRLLYTARRLGDLWGLTDDQMQEGAAAFRRRIHPQDLEMIPQRLAREQRFEPTDITFRINHPQRGQRWLRQRTRTRLLPNGEVRVYGLISDVTEEREHALQLQAARDAAEAASQAKSLFMANMSHEIRTPMNGILGMTELLLGTPMNERQRRFAQAVYRSAESLLEIINDILDFSKIEAGRLELAPADFSPRTVVEDTLELLAPRAHEKGLELSFLELDEAPAVVHGDALRLRQVLTNLVANAIKFTERGEVTVRLRLPGPASDGRLTLAFEVRDSGIGIAADVMPRLFSAFSQGHEGMARRYGGTGLGLAISRQLVELMGGTIEVNSSPGIGSTFAFTMPVGPAGQPALRLSADTLPPLDVLVVDDNETNRTVLESMLASWGLSVTTCTDGQEALDLLRDKAPGTFDLALVDGQMPRLDGMALAAALRDERLHPDMKLMLLSSSAIDDPRPAAEHGFVRFVAKPVRKAELRQAIVGAGLAGAEAEAATSARVQGHVLVVEDNPVNQEVIRQMLVTMGCTVTVASSAMAGLQALTQQRYDLILMDIQMPGMDGIEALRWFRGGRSDRFDFMTPSDVPVVAVTANALAGDDRRFLSLGFDDYVSKPFRQRHLLALLRRHLHDEGRPRNPATPRRDPPRSAPAAEPDREPAMNTPVLEDGQQVIDRAALDRLRELDPQGHARLLERVLDAFDHSVERLVPLLREAAVNGDLATLRHVAHTLKSSSASVGALELSRQCARIETGIREGRDLGDLGPLADSLQAELERSQKALHAVLGGKGDRPS